MISAFKENGDCAYKVDGICSNREVGDLPIIDESLQSKWFCSQCKNYSPSQKDE